MPPAPIIRHRFIVYSDSLHYIVIEDTLQYCRRPDFPAHDFARGACPMPVVRTSEKPLHRGNRPEWCQVTSAGVFRVPCEGGRFDCHFHDFNEYWLVFQGKAKVRSEGQEFYVKPGDIVCTRAGDEHDVVEVY